MDRFQSRRDKLRESWKDFEVEALLVERDLERLLLDRVFRRFVGALGRS